jgi:hypothetical protein
MRGAAGRRGGDTTAFSVQFYRRWLARQPEQGRQESGRKAVTSARRVGVNMERSGFGRDVGCRRRAVGFNGAGRYSP